MNLDILAVIPARGGSKEIPNKNIVNYIGQPLISHSIKQALESKYITKVMVTTDSPKIKEISEKYGAWCPFLRPSEISDDMSTDYQFFEHLLKWLIDNNYKLPKILVQLRPTYPNRQVSVIDEMISTYMNKEIYDKYDSLRTVIPYQVKKSPFKMYLVDNQVLEPLFPTLKGLKEPYNLPRQLFPEIYSSNGYMEIIKPETILDKKSVSGDLIFPWVMDSSEINDIDTWDDLYESEEKQQNSYLNS